MADFLTAHNKVMIDEKGYANDPEDSGGETYKGISRNNFPGWDGWSLVDYIKSLHPNNLNAALGSNVTLQQKILLFYRTNFWNPIKGDQIISQDEAKSIYDSAVNLGVVSAIRLAQKTLFDQADQISGVMDDNTLNRLNNIT